MARSTRIEVELGRGKHCDGDQGGQGLTREGFTREGLTSEEVREFVDLRDLSIRRLLPINSSI
jgi:hypothetical protein